MKLLCKWSPHFTRLISILGVFFLSGVALTARSQGYVPVNNTGGKKMLRDFITEQMVYPAAELKSNQGGTVTIQFTLNPNTGVSGIQISGSGSADMAQETLRIFRMINWEPATYNSIPIEESTEFTIKFDPGKYRKLVKRRGYDQLPEPYLPADESLHIFRINDLDTPPKPIFTDKRTTLGAFIYSSLKYPEEAIHQNITGKVRLGFIIETSGLISNISILNSIGAGCNEEAIRVLKLIRWMPGIKDKKAVRTQATLEIIFNLKEMENLQYVNPNLNSTF